MDFKVILYTMKNQLLVIFYVLSALLGFFTIALSIAGTFRSKIKLYRLLLCFYIAFTLMILLMFLRLYFDENGFSQSIVAALIFQGVNLLLNFLFMTSIALFLQRYFIQKWQKPLSALILLYNSIVYLLYFFPGMLTVNMGTGEMANSTYIKVASFLHLFIFIFLILVGIFGSKKDKSRREHVLIWSLVVFALFGFFENLSGFIQQFGTQKSLMISLSESFLISSIPYIFFSIVLNYYFGAYILADRQPQENLDDALMDKYKLSAREMDVIPLMNRGMNNREIAEKLCISTATVKTHIHNIYGKTKTKSRYELFHLTQ